MIWISVGHRNLGRYKIVGSYLLIWKAFGSDVEDCFHKRKGRMCLRFNTKQSLKEEINSLHQRLQNLERFIASSSICIVSHGSHPLPSSTMATPAWVIDAYATNHVSMNSQFVIYSILRTNVQITNGTFTQVWEENGPSLLYLNYLCQMFYMLYKFYSILFP